MNEICRDVSWAKQSRTDRLPLIQGHDPPQKHAAEKSWGSERKLCYVQGGESLEKGVQVAIVLLERDLSPGLGDCFRTFWFRVHGS